MQLQPAGNDAHQRLASDLGVRNVLALILQDKVARGRIIGFLRANSENYFDGLQYSLDGLRLSLGITHAADQIQAIITVLTEFYAYAHKHKDLDKKRGRLVELFAYAFIREFYEPEECLMNCHALSRAIPRKRLNHTELDLCAWSESNLSGEAYECKVQPYGLESSDFTNIITLADECHSYATAFQIGVVSFEARREVKKRLRHLAADPRIVPFGWDTIADLRIPF